MASWKNRVLSGVFTSPRKVCEICGLAGRVLDALSQFRRRLPMASKAERTDVQQVALAAPFHHRDNVIGVPKTRSLPNLQSPFRPHRQPSSPARRFQSKKFHPAIDAARRAHTVVTLEHTLAQITRIAPQFPFMDAPFRAERAAALRHFETAPPAKIAPFRSLG